MNCKFCDKEIKNKGGLVKHENGCKDNPERIIYKSNFSKYNEQIRSGEVVKLNTNQYTKAKNNGEIYTMSEDTRSKLSKANIERCKDGYWTAERRLKHSIAMKQAVKDNPESYSANNVCGRIKLVEYNGFMLNGKWELLVAKWLDNYNIKWTNKIKGFEYEWNNGVHLYFPDFYLIDLDLYIEVKGYERDRDRCKWKVVPNLIILKQKEIDLIKNNKLNANMLRKLIRLINELM